MGVAAADMRYGRDEYGVVDRVASLFTNVFKRPLSVAGLQPLSRDIAQDLKNIPGVWPSPESHLESYGPVAAPIRSPLVIGWRARDKAMRVAGRMASMVVVGLAMSGPPVLALEGTSPGMPSAALTDPSIPVPPMPIVGVPTAPQGLGGLPKSVAPAPPPSSLTALQYQAEGGHPIAQWKLGRMYANGDGVARDDLRAFDYFSRIANSHAEDSPAAPQAQVVANAFLALGRYYRDGIPNTRVKPDRERAREMFAYAASYFGNPDAQYNLARMYLDGSQRDVRYAARWLGLAAQKGQLQAQVLLGQMLFNGDQLQRQAARGLMWLTLARENASPDDDWVQAAYETAVKRASEDDRALASRMAERWAQGRRD